jgi:hypothetical protein
VDAALACPDEQKAHFGLCREFLSILSPAAAAVPHAGIGESITSKAFGDASRVVGLLRAAPMVRRKLRQRHLAPGYRAESTIVRILRRQLHRTDALAECLSAGELRRIAETSVMHPKEALDLLFTVTSLIEDLTTGTSSLECDG